MRHLDALRAATILMALLMWALAVAGQIAVTQTLVTITTVQVSVTSSFSSGSSRAPKGTLYLIVIPLPGGGTSTLTRTSFFDDPTSTVPILLTSTFTTTFTTDAQPTSVAISSSVSSSTTESTSASSSSASPSAATPTGDITVTKKQPPIQTAIVLGILLPVVALLIGVAFWLFRRHGKKQGSTTIPREPFWWKQSWAPRPWPPAPSTCIPPHIPPSPPPIPARSENRPTAPARPPRPASISESIIETMRSRSPPQGSYLHETDLERPAVPFEPVSPTGTSPLRDPYSRGASSGHRNAPYDGTHQLFYKTANNHKLPFHLLAHPNLPDRELTPEPLKIYKTSSTPPNTQFVTDIQAGTANASGSNEIQYEPFPGGVMEMSNSPVIKSANPVNLRNHMSGPTTSTSKTRQASSALPVELDTGAGETLAAYLDSDSENEREFRRAETLAFLEGRSPPSRKQISKKASSIYSRDESGRPSPILSRIAKERAKRDAEQDNRKTARNLDWTKNEIPGGFF